MTSKEFSRDHRCHEVEKAEVIGIHKQQQHGKVSHVSIRYENNIGALMYKSPVVYD